nr:hypothetical protein [uncultured bacterium]
MINFSFIYKTGKATYIRNKKQAFVFHFYFKITNFKTTGVKSY